MASYQVISGRGSDGGGGGAERATSQRPNQPPFCRRRTERSSDLHFRVLGMGRGYSKESKAEGRPSEKERHSCALTGKRNSGMRSFCTRASFESSKDLQ